MLTPQIDTSRHMLPSRAAARTVRAYLADKYGADEGASLFEQAVYRFESYCNNDIIPFCGGKKSPFGAGLYNNMLLVAAWEVEPRKPSGEKFEELVYEVSFGRRGRMQMPAWFSGDNPRVMRLFTAVYKRFAATVHRRFEAGELGGYWDVQVNVSPTPGGVQMVSGRCPVKETLERLGLLRLLRPMCNTDYPNMATKNLTLVRPLLVAAGDDVCDMRIVGPGSELARTCPPYVDADGYIVNDIPEKYAYRRP
ncbi:L-2-amino-thiazoline-4-carboxylic acid hydrolase [Paratractidigestivibacter sp.]|uniref:L-2-amino-thiazoline-4-carboxylic acid hydrolase n=1 Tax=Paratractidigestivibacter sp. TaxID=2847316 RepID=UPI002ABD88A9|nr:L-2-amino-thiazoline-4-carboxylic acid hydrolase [Paratractidigestivibacter sp.]